MMLELFNFKNRTNAYLSFIFTLLSLLARLILSIPIPRKTNFIDVNRLSSTAGYRENSRLFIRLIFFTVNVGDNIESDNKAFNSIWSLIVSTAWKVLLWAEVSTLKLTSSGLEKP